MFSQEQLQYMLDNIVKDHSVDDRDRPILIRAVQNLLSYHKLNEYLGGALFNDGDLTDEPIDIKEELPARGRLETNETIANWFPDQNKS